MAEKGTAAEQLVRVLHILPRALGEGATYAELARELDVSEAQIRRDLTEVWTRDYLGPGMGEDIQIHFHTDRVSVWTKGAFTRPVRLLPGEALALGLGLRMLAVQRRPERRDAVLDAARTLEAALATAPAGPLGKRLVTDLEFTDPDEIRPVLDDCARHRQPCRIAYWKPGDEAATDRTIEPYMVAHARGSWYVLARCRTREAVQAFRIDRVLSAQPGDGEFSVPADFDPTHHITDGQIYKAEDDVEVVVRYSPRIARWFIERDEGQAQDDGSVIVTHGVADPDWLVSQVLRYGADAVVVEPEWARERVLGAVERLLGQAG